MASSSLPNFLSFLHPTKTKTPPPPTKSPPSQVSLSTETREKNAVVAPPPLISSGLPPQALSLSASLSPASNSDVMSVVCPSFAYANTLYCRYNVQVAADEEEDGEGLIQRFRREVMRAGVIQEAKRRKFHESNQEKAKRKTKEAAKRNRKRRGPFVPYRPPGSEMEDLKVEDEVDDDYWDGYGEPLPVEEVEEDEEEAEEEGTLEKSLG